MKRTLALLAIILLPLAAQAQGMRVTLMVTSNPSPYLSDWTTRRETAILTIVSSDTRSREVRLGARISVNGALQAETRLDRVPTFTVRPGMNRFYGEDLVPASAVRFQGDIDRQVVRSGRLPSGAYSFCLRVYDASTLAPLGEEACRPFVLRSYQPPGLIAPVDAAKIPPPLIRPTLQWSSVAPQYSPRQQYELRVMEVLSAQTPAQAFRANRPILERTVTGATRLVWPPDVQLDTPMTYVWSVRALDDAGSPLGDRADGWAEPWSFTLGGRNSTTGSSVSPVVIAGRVIDNNQRPVRNARIMVKGRDVGASGDNGFFSVDIERPERRVALTFAAAGFVANTRVYDARTKSTGNVVVVWPIAHRITFDPSRPLDVTFEGSRIRIPANGVVKPGGARPAGQVELQFTLFDPTSPLARAAAPGDFSGRLLDSSIRRLNSFGMFVLDLREPDGAPLVLRPDTRIDLAIALPEHLRKEPPAKVGFFDFDVESGLWIQTGTFEFSPPMLTYNGWINRFGGANNLDNPMEVTCVTVQVLNSWDQTPMANFEVVAHGPQYDSYGTTDADGYTCLLIERNGTVTMNVHGSIGTSDYGTATPPTFTAPNFTSGAAECGDPVLCPFIGVVPADLIVGF